MACFTGRSEVVAVLLDAKAEVDICIEDPPHGPYSPLSLAVRKERTEVIEILLEHGALPDQRCVEYAERNEDAKLVAKLKCRIKAHGGAKAHIKEARPSRQGQQQQVI